MHVFCINIERSTSRWERMEARARTFGFSLTRWEATTPATLPPHLPTTPHRPTMTELEKCCSWSHMRIWMHIVANNVPAALILEDDSMFRNDAWDIFTKKTTTLDQDDPLWDMVLLNAHLPCSPQEQWVPAHNQHLAGAYYLSARGARWLLMTFFAGMWEADWMTMWIQQRQHSYTYFPWLVIQEGKDSNIRSQEGCDKQFEECKQHLDRVGYSLDNYL